MHALFGIFPRRKTKTPDPHMVSLLFSCPRPRIQTHNMCKWLEHHLNWCAGFRGIYSTQTKPWLGIRIQRNFSFDSKSSKSDGASPTVPPSFISTTSIAAATSTTSVSNHIIAVKAATRPRVVISVTVSIVGLHAVVALKAI
jgi:hypothetical protein